jgi:hypothetical protein
MLDVCSEGGRSVFLHKARTNHISEGSNTQSTPFVQEYESDRSLLLEITAPGTEV